jgi:hypothetical protein
VSLTAIQQQRLLHWARRLRTVASGGAQLDDRERDALGKLIGECEPVLNPVHVLPGVHDRSGNTR